MTRRKKPGPQEGTAASSSLRPPAIILVLALLAPLLNVIPTIEGGLREHDPEQVYLGFRWMIGDHVQYGSFARQGEAGRLLTENMFTTEPQRPSYLLLYFNLVGLVMRLSGLGFPLTWEILRVVCGFGLLLAVWWLVCIVWNDRSRRLFAWAMASYSGGLYYLASLLSENALHRPGLGFLTDPAHFQWNWSTFGSMLVALWIPPLLLLVVAAIALLREPPLPGALRGVVLFAAALLIWFIHPHSGNMAYLAFGLFGLAPLFGALWSVERVPVRRTIRRMATVAPFLASFSVVAGYLVWAGKDEVFAAAAKGAADWNPAYSIFWYPLVYGLLLPLGILGIRWSGSLPERPRQLLLSWLASAFILSVNPLFSGVKYQFLIHLPLSLLAAHGLFELRERSRLVARASRGVPGILLGGVLFLHGPISIVRDMNVPLQETYAWVDKSEVAACEFLDAQPPGAVLCGYRSCGTIAYLSGKKVFTGHWLLTLDQQRKNRDLAAFFNPAVPADPKRDFLANNGIRYVYAGPAEQRLGTVDPQLGLETIYDEGGVVIYRVP